MFIMGLFFGFSMSAFAEDNVIYGCYKKKNGKVRIVDGPDDCKKSEDSISWNMMGQGDDGKIGPTGPPGANGIDGDNGTNGNDGEVGPQGEKGDKGNDGYDGADILNELCELYKLTRYEFPEKCFNCGNGEVEPMEECDDGMDGEWDFCYEDCTWNEDCGEAMTGADQKCKDNETACVAVAGTENGICHDGCGVFEPMSEDEIRCQSTCTVDLNDAMFSCVDVYLHCYDFVQQKYSACIARAR